jgi:hypothetical protein
LLVKGQSFQGLSIDSLFDRVLEGGLKLQDLSLLIGVTGEIRKYLRVKERIIQ